MAQIVDSRGVGAETKQDIQDDSVEIGSPDELNYDCDEDDDPFQVDDDEIQQSGQLEQVQKHKEIDWSKVYQTSSTGTIRKWHKTKSGTSQCPYCPTNSKNLRSHILYCHTAENYIQWFRCNQCKYKGKSKHLLTKHIYRKHTDPNQVIDQMKKCEKCPKMFKESGDLRRHILQVHELCGNVEKKCPECEYKYVTSFQLRRHKDICHSDLENLETLQCPECNYKTKFVHKFKFHMTQQHSDAKYQCDQCAWTTHQFDKFKLHLIHHKKVKDECDLKYRCDKCPYKTYRLYSFNIHKLNHLKPEETQYFYCYHCDFKANRKDNLKTHVLKHFKHNNITLACYICDFTTVKRHLLIVHIEEHSKKMSKKKLYVEELYLLQNQGCHQATSRVVIKKEIEDHIK